MTPLHTFSAARMAAAARGRGDPRGVVPVSLSLNGSGPAPRRPERWPATVDLA
jgi:hypothetical protein